MIGARTEAEKPGSTVEGKLTTDDRVLARVTDGIYRQPGSALREMISNAWDADATEVRIDTDAPRFSTISISDDGHGMDWQTLARMLHHIGGSAKRQPVGAKLGLTQQSDFDLSPKGRPLIGKIGIGLFSIAQLTRSFQIVTKEAGGEYWNVAAVRLHTHSDTLANRNGDETYEAGSYEVWREPTQERAASGTNIILDGIWPQTRETLRSSEIWSRYEEARAQGGTGSLPALPRFSVGAVSASPHDSVQDESPDLPWETSDQPGERISRFIDAMRDLYTRGIENNPRISKSSDYYLQMLWQLSNWCPLKYVETDPFRLTGESENRFFALTSEGSDEVHVQEGRPVADSLPFSQGLRDADSMISAKDFRVFIDNVELKRPVSFTGNPKTSAALQDPLLFFGEGGTDFPKMDSSISGGPLRFFAYFQWVPKLVPVENRGIIVRVRNASGRDYDPTFLDFPVSEQRRLEQITGEIFVVEGFDGALNIDRESYNASHPHVVYLTRWVHRELRKVIAKQKQLGVVARKRNKSNENTKALGVVEGIVHKYREARSGDSEMEPLSIDFIGREGCKREGERGAYVFDRDKVIGGRSSDAEASQVESQMKGIVELMDLYDLLGVLSKSDEEDLLSGIRRIIKLESRDD